MINDIGKRFRSLHEQEGAFIIPNPWDIGSARILASFGFSSLATTSAGLAFSLGVPEGAVSRDQALEHCRQIVNATPLPVSADLEKGFADDPAGVAETIRMAAETGLAGCSIEDYTGRPDSPIYDFSHAVERICASVEAARSLSADFVLTARCENFLWERQDLDDTILRLQAYANAGADVVYAPGLRDIDLIATICKSVSKPVNVIMGLPGTTFSVDQLANVGVRRISVGSVLARLVYGLLIKAAGEMSRSGTFGFASDAAGFAEIESLLRKYG